MKIIALKPWIAREKSLPTSIEASIKRETEKAFLINFESADYWLPKSQIRSMVESQPTQADLTNDGETLAEDINEQEYEQGLEGSELVAYHNNITVTHLKAALTHIDPALAPVIQLVLNALKKEELDISDLSYN